MMRFLMIATAVVALVLTGRGQGRVDGNWSFSLSSPMGTVEAKVELKTEGQTLTGTFDLGGGREWPVQDGQMDGDTMTFSLDRDGRMTYLMKGTLEGDTIKGVAMAMGTTVDWTMTRVR